MRGERKKEMTGTMKEAKQILDKIERIESVIQLLKNPASNVSISVNMTHIEVTRNITSFIRTEYELKLKELERQWREWREMS